MKPNNTTSRQFDRLDQERFSGSRLSRPLIDYQFRTRLTEREFRGTGKNPRQARPLFAPGFRAVSNKFFETEAKLDYAAEALLFVIIAATAAWPVASMLRALIDLVR